MPVSVTVHVDNDAEIGELISDLYSVMQAYPYTSEALIPILCAFEFTEWSVDGDDAFRMHKELSAAISTAVKGVVERFECDAKNGTERTCCKD